MQAIIDISIAAVAWAVTVFKFNAVHREWRGDRDRRVLSSWAFALFFSLCMTFQVDAVYVTVDTLVGVNNLSWLLAYLCLILAIYFVCTGCCIAMKVDPPRWALPYLAVTAGLLVIIFPFGVATTPEWADHTVPRSVPEFLFMELLYTYAIIMGVIPALAFARFQRNEGTLPTRLRTSVILLAAILAITFFVVKVVASLLGLLVPSLPLVLYLMGLSRLLMAASGLLWTLTFAPNRLYLALARPFMFHEKVLALRDLRSLQARLNHLCPPVVPDQPTWWDQLRSLDFYIYQTVIGILDGRKMLASRLEQLDRPVLAGGPGRSQGARVCPELAGRSPSNRGRSEGEQRGAESAGRLARSHVQMFNLQRVNGQYISTSPPLPGWDGPTVEEAIRLHWALQSVPEPQDFDGLVAAYRDLSRRLELEVR